MVFQMRRKDDALVRRQQAIEHLTHSKTIVAHIQPLPVPIPLDIDAGRTVVSRIRDLVAEDALFVSLEYDFARWDERKRSQGTGVRSLQRFFKGAAA